MISDNLLLISPGPLPKRFLSTLRKKWKPVILKEGDPSLLEKTKDIFTTTPLAAVLVCGTETVERRFAAVRHMAGPDQTVICVLFDAGRLRRLPSGARGIKAKEEWRTRLSRADAVWVQRPADAEWVRSALRASSTPDVFSPDPAELGKLLERASLKTFRQNSYGDARDLASVIVLTHNDGKYLRRCLDSVRRHTAGPHEVIVVDNATTDGSAGFLRREKGLRVIRQDKNLFFSGGVNAGLKGAWGRYLVLLNADTIVTAGWLEKLVRRLKRDETIGLAGPCTNSAAGRQRVENAPRSAKSLDAFAARWAKEHDGGRLDVPRLDGFCLAFRRDVMEHVGLFDERFGPGGYEDYDYCLRVRQAGYRVVLVEDVYVHHEGGKGYRGRDYEALRRRNREVLVEKWCRRSLEFLDEVW
jgi:GT2 family glycosyltransferase